MNATRLLSLATAAVLSLAAAARAAETLATWPLKNTSAGNSDTNVLAASDITLGKGLTGPDLGDYGYSAKGWPTNSAPKQDAYFEFSVTATDDYNLLLDVLKLNLRSSTTGPQGVEVQYAVGGGTWNKLTSFAHKANSKGIPYELDVSSLMLGAGKTLSFRIYGYGGTSTANGTFRMGNDSEMVLTGTAVGTKQPPTVTFPGDEMSVPVSNTLSVAIGVQPDGSGIKSWTFAPGPSGAYSLAGTTFKFTPTAADKGNTFTLTVIATNSFGGTTNALPVTVTEYVPVGAWMTGFETGKDPGNQQSPTDWEIDGRTWSIQQLSFSDKADLPKVGARACVFGSYNPAFMVSSGKMLDSSNGLGTVSFLYGEYPGESEPCQPIIVEVSTDPASGDWMEVGRVNPLGVSTPEKASFDVFSSEPLHLRIRTEYVNKSGRVCIDQLTVLPYEKPVWNDFEKYLLKYNVTPGDPGCASQNYWAEGETSESYLTDDFDEDLVSNWDEFKATPQTNPYDKNSHP